MTVAEALRHGAAQVRKGWTQGVMYDRGKVCALEALALANRIRYADTFILNEYEIGPGSDAMLALAAVLPAASQHSLPLVRSARSITAWNDAPGQTQENVATTMEFAALVWEEARKVESSMQVAVAQGE